MKGFFAIQGGIFRRIYAFHIQCIIKVEDLNALYLEN